ncbi:MAG: primosomal protein N' [Deltaproteobacteria bacterium]|jgi:primosomal protein N' (replication factor Y)|nr:primosomal protein N' [Deltaproteobacteria bacterium]
MSVRIARVAVAAPLHSLFDYQIPATVEVAVGSRVRVSFGHSRPIGVVVEIVDSTDRPSDSLKSLEAVLDREPLLRQQDLDFLTWAAAYYHHPIGEVVAAALPLRLRKAEKMLPAGEPAWGLTAEGRQLAHDLARRAPRQAEILGWLSALPTGQAPQAVLRAALPDSGAILRVLHGKGWIKPLELPATPDVIDRTDAGPRLNPEQLGVLDALSGDVGRFAVSLLDGVTGSGKTEVYLRLAAAVLARGQGVLVLVPEISLTPQLLARFRERLGDTVRVLHSGLTENEREQTWQRMRLGLSHVLLGTRSAIFTPLADLGLVVVDEEHDTSFKQTEGFRYSARDLAVVRAQRSGCPVVLGSATPSLESLRNAQLGRYRQLRLDRRAGSAQSPRIDLLDIRDQPLRAGMSQPLFDRVAAVLGAGEQVMLFLNRRGYAPVLSCFSCGWLSDCPHCDARQTLHKASGLLCCHHCGAQRRVPFACPACSAEDLHPLGQGTEQLEGFLSERFADFPLIRIDRDATSRKGSLERQLSRLHQARAALLVGTQMLAKGHHFPRVTLVGVVDADGGLYSADFRSTERMAQLLVQVAGRAGRGDRPGHVLIQTRHPDHPLLQTLVRHGYRAFAGQALSERAAAGLPPFSHQALLRADATRLADAESFLDGVADWARRQAIAEVELWGPVPAPMVRRAGRHRAHLLIQARQRDALHVLLQALPEFTVGLPKIRRVRWSLDVDPIDLY